MKTLNASRMSRDEWLEQRTRGLGGSDAAAAIGLSRWKSPFRLFLEKTGQIDRPEANERMQIGLEVEEAIFQMVRKRLEPEGLNLTHNNEFFVSEEYPWMLGNIDGDIYDPENDSFGVLEIKFVSPYGREEWTGEDIPQEYLIQLQHYFVVTERTWGIMAALIGNERLIIKRVEKDEELCQMMIEKEREFWEENVLKNIPPEVDGSSDTEEILNSLYPSAKNESIVLSPNADQIIEELQDLKAKAKELDSEITERENILKQMLGENEAGKASNHWVFWKNFTSKRFDTTRFKNDNPDLYNAYTKESEYRKFTIKEVK